MTDSFTFSINQIAFQFLSLNSKCLSNERAKKKNNAAKWSVSEMLKIIIKNKLELN